MPFNRKKGACVYMITQRSFCNQPRRKICSQCGVSFVCGPSAAKEKCWCYELPHVPLLASDNRDCRCPECLAEAILKPSVDANEAIDGRVSTKTNVVSSFPLMEEVDYYCEGSAVVFTASYLLRRGYCCKSGCRHCPYKS